MSFWHFALAYVGIGLIIGFVLAAWEIRNRLRGWSDVQVGDYALGVALMAFGWFIYAPMLYGRWKEHVRQETYEHESVSP